MSTPSARRPAGRGLAALAGSYPDPAIGLPPAAGFALWDDFFAPREIVPSERVEARFGDLLWASHEFGGGNSTYTAITPSDWDECGILQIQTPGSATKGPQLFLSPVPPFYRHPPPGSVWACKLRIVSGTTNYEMWSGFANAQNMRVTSADSNSSFLGARSVGGNIFGVAKSAATETTVDLGVSWEGSAWRIVGFEVGGTFASPSVQFFRIDPLATNRDKWDRQDIGAPITTNLPAVPTTPLGLGIVTTSAVAKIVQIDWWALGGRAARG